MKTRNKLIMAYALSLGAMSYSAYALHNPPTAAASTCCAEGSQCGGGDFCCWKPSFASCDGTNTASSKKGYCLSSCS